MDGTLRGYLTIYKNMMYGVAAGGANISGCIFSIDTNGNGYTDIFDFNGSNGISSGGDLIIIGGKLFGTAGRVVAGTTLDVYSQLIQMEVGSKTFLILV